MGIHHVQLVMPAGQEDAAVAFYSGVLGLTRVAKPDHLQARGGCWFEDGPTRVHLGVDPHFRPARKAHPALLVDDLAAVKASLVAHGIEVVDDEPLAGFDRIYVSDSFGNRLELLQEL